MNRLNYFNPYQSISDTHEDHLTRAYLVLLKHSFHAFSIFFEYCKHSHTIDSSKEEKPILLYPLLENGWDISTQVGNPVITTERVLSVLITDTALGKNSNTTPSERNARYDGIITFGTQLTIIIENKPRSGNVWLEQLNPSRDGLSEDAKIYSHASQLEWKAIIRQLNDLLTVPTITGYEKMLIEDFLALIDQNYPYLNPYDSFHLCKGYAELIQRRIQNILKALVVNEDIIKYHNGWGFYIETPYAEIRKIGLIYNSDEAEKDWWLELSLYFGDTQKQSIALYQSSPTLDHLSDNWWCISNFHFAYQSTNLVWLRNKNDIKNYINFWQANMNKIQQQKKERMPAYIQWLKDENVVPILPKDEDILKEKFYNTGIPTLNICPGFGAVYEIESKDAEIFDRKGILKQILLDRIKEGLKIIGKDGSEFLKLRI